MGPVALEIQHHLFQSPWDAQILILPHLYGNTSCIPVSQILTSLENAFKTVSLGPLLMLSFIRLS